MITKWKTVAKKDAESLKLNGCTIETEWNDSTLVAVVFRSGDEAIKLTRDGYCSGMTALVIAPPTLVDRYRVTGEVAGLKVNELFQDKYTAESRASTLRNFDNGQVTVESVQVGESEPVIDCE